MADGTLRISFDIEPDNAQDAFRLFAAPGTPAAIAALQVGYMSKKDEKLDTSDEHVQKSNETIHEPKGGALAKLAGMWCADKTFQAWLETDPDNAAPNESGATLCLYALCEIESRRELDHDPAAAERFNRLIRGPYMKWRASKGLL
jgi:hypothetical protein